MTSAEHEHADGQGSQPATTYASAAAAVSAMLRHARAKEFPFMLGPEQRPTPPDWSAAAAVIAADSNKLPLDGVRFQELETAIQEVPDHEARDAIRRVTQSWAEANWAMVEAGLREEALRRFNKISYPFEREFGEFVARWPRLQRDPRLIADAIRAIGQGRPALDAGVAQLRVLKGDQAAAAHVLSAAMAPRMSFHERDELASLFAEWAGDGVWGQLQHLLWRVGTETDRPQTIPPDLSPNVLKAAELLGEFGLTIGKAPDYPLSELSAESKASWRRQLKAVIGDNPALRLAVAEALLWFGANRDDRAVLFAVLELHDNRLETALAPFLAHSDRLVRRRAAAAIDMARREPDAMELLRSNRSTARPRHSSATGGLGPARTWIGDARIERLIEDTLNDAARSAGSDINRALGSGEETHVPVLFERLRGAFSAINDRLAALAAETNANERLSLKLEHRIVGKPEEGGPGVGTKRFSVDVCLLFEARDSGKRFAPRLASSG